MNCKICTYVLKPGTIRCEMCSTETDKLKPWFDERSLHTIYKKIPSINITNLFDNIEKLPMALSTSELNNMEAIRLSYEIGLYKGINKGVSESVYEDRMIRQEQEFEYKLSILKDKITSLENEKKISNIIIDEKEYERKERSKENERIANLSPDDRRKMVAESWISKYGL